MTRLALGRPPSFATHETRHSGSASISPRRRRSTGSSASTTTSAAADVIASAGRSPTRSASQPASSAPRVGDEKIETGKGAISVTISLGGAVSAGADTDLDKLIRVADEALYAAKDAGRNRHELRVVDAAGNP